MPEELPVGAPKPLWLGTNTLRYLASWAGPLQMKTWVVGSGIQGLLRLARGFQPRRSFPHSALGPSATRESTPWLTKL